MLFVFLLGLRAHADRFLITPRGHAAYLSLRRELDGASRRARLDALELLVVETADASAWRADPRVADVEAELFHPVSRLRVGRAAPAPVAWNVAAVRAPEAWSGTRGRGARVMVLDSGVDGGHPAIAPALTGARNFVGPGDARDRDGHGTHVTATVLNVAPEARVLAGRVCDQNTCGSAAIAAGLDWAVGERVDAVNLSIAGDQLTRAERLALARAEEAGVVVVAASGNDGVGLLAYPAAVDTVISVGAIDRARHVPNFSQWGPQLSIVAPGVDVYAAMPRGKGRLARASVGPEEIPVRAVEGSPAGTVDGEIVDPDGRRDVRGKIVLQTAGPAFVVEDVESAVRRGAAAVWIADDATDVLIPRLGRGGRDVAIPVVRSSPGALDHVRARLSAGPVTRARLEVVAADYGYLQGTSMAAPHVAGVIALLKSKHARLSPGEVRALVRTTAARVDSSVNGRAGFGVIDAEGVLRAAER